MEKRPIRVTLCTRIPLDAYMGGMAVLMKQYMEKADFFLENDVALSLFSWHDLKIEAIKNTKLRNVLYWISFWKASLRYCRQEKPDIFHIHTAREFLFLRDVLVGSSIVRRYGIKCALTIHVGALETVFHRIPKCLHKRLIRLLNKYFCKVFFLSRTIQEEFVAFGLNRELCTVLYNFHNMPEIIVKQALGDEPRRFLFVGAIQREKGILELMGATEALISEKKLHLDICGLVNDASVKTRFDRFCEQHPDTVTAHGYATGELKTKLFFQADVLVLPSYHEGLPLVILEALASGCAIISTPVGATPEILGEKNAIWVPVQDGEALREAMRSLIDDTQRLSEMKQANRALADSYSFETHAGRLCQVYHQITLTAEKGD